MHQKLLMFYMKIKSKFMKDTTSQECIKFKNGSMVKNISVNEDVIRGKRRKVVDDWSDLNSPSKKEIDEVTKSYISDNFKEYYKRYPDKFLERYFNLKLYWYQKIILRTMRNIKYNIIKGGLK